MDRLSLTFLDPGIERRFRASSLEGSLPVFRVAVGFVSILTTILTVTSCIEILPRSFLPVSLKYLIATLASIYASYVYKNAVEYIALLLQFLHFLNFRRIFQHFEVIEGIGDFRIFMVMFNVLFVYMSMSSLGRFYYRSLVLGLWMHMACSLLHIESPQFKLRARAYPFVMLGISLLQSYLSEKRMRTIFLENASHEKDLMNLKQIITETHPASIIICSQSDPAKVVYANQQAQAEFLEHEGGLSSLLELSLIHISEPTRLGMISYAVFCLKKKRFITIKSQ
eukprot:TRINITY_DN10719_c0_g1_i1.p1 TRINITY_DN10719_c0_g1~~TRINITY_DN10719_c0_g1_i1.p1  ORF type:complete len:282 (-),score=62.57 TRINITY_DN10719_c0_g1_i1:79-924(-)